MPPTPTNNSLTGHHLCGGHRRQPALQRPTACLTFIDATSGPQRRRELFAQQAATDFGRSQPPAVTPNHPSSAATLVHRSCDENRVNSPTTPVSTIVHHCHRQQRRFGRHCARHLVLPRRHPGLAGHRLHYLVDAAGAIYEGHAGGDDVIGIHASVKPTPAPWRAPGTFNGPDEDPPGDRPHPGHARQRRRNFWPESRPERRRFDALATCPTSPGACPTWAIGRSAPPFAPATRPTPPCPPCARPSPTGWALCHRSSDITTSWPRKHLITLGNRVSQDGPLSWHRPARHYAWSTTSPGAGVSWAEMAPEITAPAGPAGVYALLQHTNAPDTQGAVYEVTTPRAPAASPEPGGDLGIWVPLGDCFEAGTTGRAFT